jgi:hypothetical protein
MPHAPRTVRREAGDGRGEAAVHARDGAERWRIAPGEKLAQQLGRQDRVHLKGRGEQIQRPDAHSLAAGHATHGPSLTVIREQLNLRVVEVSAGGEAVDANARADAQVRSCAGHAWPTPTYFPLGYTILF